MRAIHVLLLDEWVKENLLDIMAKKGTQQELAELAGAKLNFKVSTNALRDVLLSNNIVTKTMSKHGREVYALNQEIATLRALLVKVVTAATLPQWLLEEIETSSNLDDEVRAALQKTPVMA